MMGRSMVVEVRWHVGPRGPGDLASDVHAHLHATVRRDGRRHEEAIRMPKPGAGHQVKTVPSTQTVRVEIDGLVVAESSRPVALYETGLPVRYYLPPNDVNLDLFQATDTRTTCPFKGEAAYWTYVGPKGGTAEPRPDVVWAYPKPIDGVTDIADHLSFYDTVARVVVEGEPPTP
jgi:uncharacterized protein (DUF427 family)